VDRGRSEIDSMVNRGHKALPDALCYVIQQTLEIGWSDW
jgi:hypothetical protein